MLLGFLKYLERRCYSRRLITKQFKRPFCNTTGHYRACWRRSSIPTHSSFENINSGNSEHLQFYSTRIPAGTQCWIALNHRYDVESMLWRWIKIESMLVQLDLSFNVVSALCARWDVRKAYFCWMTFWCKRTERVIRKLLKVPKPQGKN